MLFFVVVFLLYHWSLNYWPGNICEYKLALCHSLVSPFAVTTHRRLSTCTTPMPVRFVYDRTRCATKVEISHALATLSSNNFVVYDQKHKVWVLVFLVSRTSRTF